MNQTNEDIDGDIKEMWVGIEGIIGNQAGKIGNGIATLRTQSGKNVP